MYTREEYEAAARAITERGSRHHTALVLGSGLGGLFKDSGTVVPYSEIPGFLESTAPMHRGELIITDNAYILCGRFHRYEGYTPQEITFYIRALRFCGVERLILTNAAGAVNEELCPGDIALITDHINLSGESPLIGTNDDAVGERFPGMAEAYSPRLRRIARDCAAELDIQLREGVYFYMSGPSYETQAEIRAIKTLGGDLVGMSTVFECIAANHCGMEVLGLSCVTNMACGVGGTAVSSEDVELTAAKSADKMKRLLKAVLDSIDRISAERER